MSGTKDQFPVDLLGRYSSPVLLGQGGMGLVFAAEDTVLDKSVAIKVLPAELQQDQKLVRFQKEARAAGKLNHPNIVSVLDFGVTKSGEPYMVMDFLDGQTLQDALAGRRQEDRLDLPTLLELIRGVCRGLSHAHEKGVLHRDIKSSNIMLCPVTDNAGVSSLQAQLIDFGIAHMRKEATEEGFESTGQAIVGSPAYMAPEIGRGGKATPRSDVYSLGCVLYQGLTGTVPFQADSSLALIEKHANEKPRPLLDFIDLEDDEFFADTVEAPDSKPDSSKPDPSKPESQEPETPNLENRNLENRKIIVEQLQLLIDRALAKDPQARFADTTEMHAAIFRIEEEFLHVEPASGPEFEKGMANRTRSFLSSKLGAASLGGMVLFSSLIAFFLYNRLNNPEKKADGIAMSKPYADPNKAWNGINVVTQFGSSMLDGAEAVTDKDIIAGRVKGIKEGNLQLSDSQVTNKTIEALTGKEIKSLDLSYTKVTGEGLKHIPKIKGIHTLELNGLTGITDESLKYLVPVDLYQLNMDSTKISDKGLMPLVAIPKLQMLSLTGCDNITDRGILAFKDHPKLTNLSVSSTKVSSKALGQLSGLTCLRVNFNGFDDSDVQNLLSLNKLEVLYLRGSKITPEGVKLLCKLPKLNRIDLNAAANLSEADFLPFKVHGIRAYQ
ncbi:MAG: protein kinase [Cyanobacteriota/Melainabacteria group bacterium]